MAYKVMEVNSPQYVAVIALETTGDLNEIRNVIKQGVIRIGVETPWLNMQDPKQLKADLDGIIARKMREAREMREARREWRVNDEG